jgi:hypothetical protein
MQRLMWAQQSLLPGSYDMHLSARSCNLFAENGHHAQGTACVVYLIG